MDYIYRLLLTLFVDITCLMMALRRRHSEGDSDYEIPNLTQISEIPLALFSR